MNSYKSILRMPDGDGGGGTTTTTAATTATTAATTTAPVSFLSTLPAEYQTDPAFKNIDSAATLAKGFKHAQSLIGAKRIAAPDGNWTEQQYGEMYDALGRPKTADEYTIPKFDLPEGLKLDDARMKVTRAALHKAGLSQRQADAVLGHYFETVSTDFKNSQALRDQATAAATAELKTGWGDKFDTNLNLAKAVAQKFGGQDVLTYLNESGLGNDPKIIKLLHGIGTAMMDDRDNRGGDPLVLTDQSKALKDIQDLNSNSDFMKALNDRSHPGHKAAVERRMNLFKIAYPGQVAPQ